MKKALLISGLIIVSALASGCGADNASKPAAKINQANASSVVSVALPDRRADVITRVKDIIGNEITVYKVQVDAAGQGQRQRPAQRTEQQSQSQTQGAAEAQGAAGSGATQAQGTQERQGMTSRMSFSEETETFIIPVGTPIAMVQRGSRDAVSAELSQIKKDQMISVWKNNGEIEFIQITGAATGGSANRSQSQQQGGQAQAGGAGGFGGFGGGPQR